ncbi:unnamed protein product [Amoebophrya sp. A25]|nr:unnamed protein product [Amoebophrya sp. A25]|eukprot:GSA25T00019700001.1
MFGGGLPMTSFMQMEKGKSSMAGGMPAMGMPAMGMPNMPNMPGAMGKGNWMGGMPGGGAKGMQLQPGGGAPFAQPGGAEQRDKDREVFAGGLPQTCTKADFDRHFEQFGRIVKAEFKDGKGYGFITFSEVEEAKRAIDCARSHPLHGKLVDVKPAEKRAQAAFNLNQQSQQSAQWQANQQNGGSNAIRAPSKPACIFVGGLPPTCHAEKFRSYFEKWGRVLRADLREGKGYGFITFESMEVLNMVIANREQHAIDGKWIDCKPAEDRRQAQDALAKSAATAPAQMMFDPTSMTPSADPFGSMMNPMMMMMSSPEMMVAMSGMLPTGMVNASSGDATTSSGSAAQALDNSAGAAAAATTANATTTWLRRHVCDDE